MHRVIADQISDDRAILSEEESHHLVRVLRTRPGAAFVALNGCGNAFLCRLRRAAHQWYGEIVEELDCYPESPLEICLAQSLIKKDKFEWVIQKAVELGVSEIVPLIAWRTEVRPDEEGLERKMTRWRRILVDAFKQSGRSRLPQIRQPVGLGPFLESRPTTLRFALDETGGLHLRDLIERHRAERSCIFLVGPEGGWDDQDRCLFAANCVETVHLGHRILRTETCPVVVLSILQYELGDLGPQTA